MAKHETPKNSKRKGTKAALAASFAALLLCGATLVGTTFAWFTDTATTGSNIIQAGELGIDLQVYDSSTNGYTSVRGEDLESGVTIFGSADATKANENNSNTLWEPGKVQIAYFKIENTKSLALKYRAVLNVENPADGKNLYKVMEYVNIPDVKGSEALENRTDVDFSNAQSVKVGDQLVKNKENDGHLLPGQSHYFAVAIRMQEGADNAYQNGQVNFTLRVEATQDTVERDSFDTQYDANANYLGTTATAFTGEALNIDLELHDYDPSTGVANEPTPISFTKLVKYQFPGVNPEGWAWHMDKLDGNSNQTYLMNKNGEQVSSSYAETKMKEMAKNQYDKSSALPYANNLVEIVLKSDHNISAGVLKAYMPCDSNWIDNLESAASTSALVDIPALTANTEYKMIENHLATIAENGMWTVEWNGNIVYGQYVDDTTNEVFATDATYKSFAARTMLDGFLFGISKNEGASVDSETEIIIELRLYEVDENGEATDTYTVLNTDKCVLR